MKIIDTHCHLEQEEFYEDLDYVVSVCASQDIYIITSAISPDTWNRGAEIAEKYDNVYASTGLDPVNFIDSKLCVEWIHKNHERVISVGEIGLDHYRIRDHKERELQANAFRELIAVAKDYDLPIQTHSRSAGKRTLEVLSSNEAEQVHMHAFDGKSNLARVASRDLGYYFSIPTSVVRSPQKRKLVKAVDIERLLVETDSPVLGPLKGERNEPSNVIIALREIADILRRDKEEIREVILENTLRFYSRIK